MEVVKIHIVVRFNKGTSCKLYLLELLLNHWWTNATRLVKFKKKSKFIINKQVQMQLQNIGEYIIHNTSSSHTHIYFFSLFFLKRNTSQVNEIKKYDGLPPIKRFLLRH